MRRYLLIACFFLAASAQALTLSEIRTEVRLRIKDTSTTRQRFSDTQINNIINQTHRDVVNLVWPIHKTQTISLVANTTYYTLASDLIQIERLRYDNRNLDEVTPTKLDSDYENSRWRELSGIPKAYFQEPGQPEQIGFYPYPNGNTGSTEDAILTYFAQANDLSSDSDEPFNAIDRYLGYSDLLIYEPVYKIFLIEGELAKAQEYRGYYESRLELMISLTGERPNYNPSFVGQRK